MFYLDFSIKRISSIILLFLISFGLIIPISQAKDNPLYVFEKTNGVPALLKHTGLEYLKKDGQKVDITLNPAPFVSYHRNISQRWGDDTYYLGQWKGYLYIDTFKLPKDRPTPIINFPINNSYTDCPADAINCGMNAILYMPEEKAIVSALGYVNAEGRGINRINVIYTNIDENTPNFMFFLDFRRHTFKDSLGKWQSANSMRVIREDKPGSGKLSTKEENIFTAGATPLRISDEFHIIVSGSSALTVLQYNFEINGRKIGLFEPRNLCYYVGFSNFDSDPYKNCLEEAQEFIYKVYGKAWTDDFGFQGSKEPIGTITDNNNVYDSSAPSPILDEEAPEPPTCEFGDGVISCAVEWIGYYFSKLIYGFKSIFSKFFKLTFGPLVNMGKTITGFFIGIFDYIKNTIIDLSKISFTGTMQTCKTITETEVKNNTIGQNLTNIVSLAIPFAPVDNSEICTFEGRKVVDYPDNTRFLDIIFVLISFSTIIFNFLGSQKHD